jgi:hypothetical protein
MVTRVVPAPVTRTTPRRFRLGRTNHKIALAAHVLSAVGWFGVAALVAFFAIVAGTSGDRALSRALYRTLETSVWLSIPLGIAAFGTGTVLSVGTKWGLVRHWWVVAKIVIAAVVVVTDALVVRSAAHDAVVHGATSGDLYGPTIAHCVVLGTATVLSVFKPRGRTPFGRTRERA